MQQAANPSPATGGFELGLYYFAELTPNPRSGRMISPAQALDESFPVFSAVINKIGRERGWPPMTRQQFDASATLHGANFVGDPDAIIEKFLHQHTLFNHSRLLLQLGVGTMPHAQMMHAIELLGTRVMPAVKAEIARR